MTEVLRLKLPVDAAAAVAAMSAIASRHPESRVRYGRNGYLIVEVPDPTLEPVES